MFPCVLPAGNTTRSHLRGLSSGKLPIYKKNAAITSPMQIRNFLPVYTFEKAKSSARDQLETEFRKIERDGVTTTNSCQKVIGTAVVNVQNLEVGYVMLPAEIWEFISLQLSHSDLLRFRLVNRKFHSLASSILRHRFTPLPEVKGNRASADDGDIDLESIYSTFGNSDNQIWSACTLQLWRSFTKGVYPLTTRNKLSCYRPSLPTTQAKSFNTHFGKHIMKLTLKGNCFEQLRIILIGLPNLLYLDVSDFRVDEPVKGPFNLQLTNLKVLISTIWDTNTFKVFKILRNTPNVRRIQSLYLQITPGDYLETLSTELVSILQNILCVRLDINSVCPISLNFFNAFTTFRGTINLNELTVNFEENVIPGDTYYNSFEDFLAHISNTLRKLALYDSCRNQNRRKGSLTVPTMPKLECLEIIDCRNLENKEPHLSFLSPFTARMFPKLKTLSVFCKPIDKMLYFESTQIWTVTRLVLRPVIDWGQCEMNTNWELLLPNLENLEADVTGAGLENILKGAQNLKTFHLKLRQNEGEDVDAILCGFILAQFNPPLIWNQVTQDKYAEFRNKFSQPCLVSMTHLHTLEIWFDWTVSRHVRATDALIYGCFLQMRPLKTLVLSNLAISKIAKQKLNEHHQKFQLLTHN